MKDLRQYLAACKNRVEITRATRCAHEIPAVLAALESSDNFDAVIFRNVINDNGAPAEYSVAVNLFARQDAIAQIWATGGIFDCNAFNERVARDGAITIMDRQEAPVAEVVTTGALVDLMSLPVVTHHERDAGPYLTSGIVVVRDPETGVHNAAIQRLLVQDRATLGIFMVPTGQNQKVRDKYATANKDMPVAVVVGHHPLFYLGVQTREPIHRDEYHVAASVMGETLRLMQCTSSDLLVPADADLVLEGVLPMHSARQEGPFGEYSHYYCEPAQRECITVTSILHRKNPVFMDIFACHRDHHQLEGAILTAQLTHILRAEYPEFVRLSLPLSGCCQMYCYVSIRNHPGFNVKEAGLRILAVQEYVKYVVFVDADVDVENEAEVLWAMTTRSSLGTDMLLTRSAGGTQMDPTVRDGKLPERGVIDATAKDPALLANRVRIKPAVLSQIDLAGYLERTI
jgi:2,5-furandicarboxylate decarboxylase 1